MTPDEIEWCDPPPDNFRSVAKFVDILQSRPGQWAKYPRPMARSSIRTVARRNAASYPGTEWRSAGNVLYGRWVGDGS